jgi:hypothetical protein
MLLAPEPCSALTVSTSPFKRQVPWPDLFPSKDPSLLYELVKPVFQQIFLPRRSASVTGAAEAHTDLIQYKHRQNHWDYTHCSTPFLRLEMQAPEF